jgi:DNA polymerase-1
LFDGNALMHRAYHALPPLTSPQGQLVNAVYGFFSILLSALLRHKPAYLAVAFDVKGPTFRDRLYKEYKAKRVKPPQDFYDQIPTIKRLLRLMEIPILERRGYEADDVIGSVSSEIGQRHPQLEILIVTSDMDALQLIRDKVKFVDL